MTTIEGDIDLVLVLATLFVCLVVIPALCVLWLGWITRDASCVIQKENFMSTTEVTIMFFVKSPKT